MAQKLSAAALAKADRDREELRLLEALQVVIDGGLDVHGNPKISLRSTATRFDVSRSQLTGCYRGRCTRAEARETQQSLTPVQEVVLVAWVHALGRRGIPLSPGVVAEYASNIAGKPIQQGWTKAFRARHPEIKGRWTTGLECCRAKALNRTQVAGFFGILDELITKHNIPPENIYNMDEKGVQLGVGGRVYVLVDRDQKSVMQVEDGNRELITIIETVCADGDSIRPSVIFKAKRRDLQWGRNNPCDARYVFS
jgi:hypothetical protein